MSEASRWLSSRRPEAPEALAEALRVVLAGEPEVGADRAQLLARLGRVSLDEARARPGRVRESAYRLLVADALITYACEAALELDDPETRLLELVEATAAP